MRIFTINSSSSRRCSRRTEDNPTDFSDTAHERGSRRGGQYSAIHLISSTRN